jgi:hypothetical protein
MFTMRRAVVVAVFVIALLFLGAGALQGWFGWLFPETTEVDTTTIGFEVAGYSGVGYYAGELLKSDIIVTNITNDSLSQSIVFRGRICQRVPDLGTVFLDGSKANEPDVIYKVFVNDVPQFAKGIEMGSTSTIIGCIDVPGGEYIITGQALGVVRVEMLVYVYEFARGAGAYSLLLSDQAILSA